MTDSNLQQRKRELRLRIGRMRRRINNHLHDAHREGRGLLSWRQYMMRYPGYALLAAFGVGLAASGGLWRGRLLRRLGLQAVHQATEWIGKSLWQEFQRIWSQLGEKP